MVKQFLEAGKIVGTHGVRGEMRLEPWMDSPEALKKIKKMYLDEGRKDIGLISSRVHKNILLITVKDIDSATVADTMRGKVVYIDRNDVRLPKNRYFIADLIDIDVYDGNTGRYYGKIAEVFATGANNVYRIVGEKGEYLFPAVDHMIKSTDIHEGRMEVLPIPGIFDDDTVVDREG